MRRISSTNCWLKTVSRNSFLVMFNPDAQERLCADTEDCLSGDYPTLGEMGGVWGTNTAKAWLVPQLVDLSEYCGCKEKMSVRMLEQCASVIVTEYPYLKVTEYMLFFHRMKAGRYGEFYGSVDPQRITTSLRRFIAERNEMLAAIEQREREKRQAEEMKASPPVSWEEYCRRTGREPGPVPTVSFPKVPNVK